jgi:hypothetical protein
VLSLQPSRLLRSCFGDFFDTFVAVPNVGAPRNRTRARIGSLTVVPPRAVRGATGRGSGGRVAYVLYST